MAVVVVVTAVVVVVVVTLIMVVMVVILVAVVAVLVLVAIERNAAKQEAWRRRWFWSHRSVNQLINSLRG